MERFQLKPTIFFGSDALAALEGLAGRRVMVITDSFLAQSGLLERVRARLRDCTVEVFDQVVPDPPLELVAQGFGITVLLDTPPVHRPDVKVLPLTQPVQMGDFYIVRRKPPHPLANVDRFFDFCVEQARHPAQDLPPVSLPAAPAE